MISITDIIRDCRFIADASCCCLFCPGVSSCNVFNFFAVLFYLCSKWSPSFCDVSMITIHTKYFVHNLALFLIRSLVFRMYQYVPYCSVWFQYFGESFTKSFNVRYCNVSPALWSILFLISFFSTFVLCVLSYFASYPVLPNLEEVFIKNERQNMYLCYKW